MFAHRVALLVFAYLRGPHALHSYYGISHTAKENNGMKALVITVPNPSYCALQSATIHSTCDPHLERLQVFRIPFSFISPPPGMAIVRIRGAAANPADWKRMVLPSTTAPGSMFGFELAGEVMKTGAGCSHKVGDSVYGRAWPAYAEYITLECGEVGLMPSRLNFTEAASMPAAALPGLEAFHRTGAPWKSRPTVLVIGGSSAAGHLGIQLAKALGAGKVITTCSRRNLDFVKKMGADQAMDYRTQNWWTVLGKGSVDVIYDCIGATGSAVHAYELLPDGGKYVQIYGKLANETVAQARPQVEQLQLFLNRTSQKYLNQLTQLVDQGVLRPSIQRTYAGLDSIPSMVAEMMEGHVVGKLTVRI